MNKTLLALGAAAVALTAAPADARHYTDITSARNTATDAVSPGSA